MKWSHDDLQYVLGEKRHREDYPGEVIQRVAGEYERICL
jgi:hypothetical protein